MENYRSHETSSRFIESKDHRRIPLAMHTLRPSVTYQSPIQRVTHNPPSRNIPETANLRPLDICRFHTLPMGSPKMITSIVMFGTELPKKNSRVLMHLDGVVRSQKPRMGLQEKIETRMQATAQPATSPPTRLVAMVNPRVGKIER